MLSHSAQAHLATLLFYDLKGSIKLSVWNFSLNIRMWSMGRKLLLSDQKGGLEMLNILFLLLAHCHELRVWSSVRHKAAQRSG